MKFNQVLKEFKIDEANAFGENGVFGIEFKTNPTEIKGAMSKSSTQGLRGIRAIGRDPASFTENLAKAMSEAGYKLATDSKNDIRKKLKEYMPKISRTKGVSITKGKIDFVASFKGNTEPHYGNKEIEMTKMTTGTQNKYDAKGKGRFKVAFPDEIEEPQEV